MSCTTVTKTMRKERFEAYVGGLSKDKRKAFKTIKRHYNAIKGAQTRLRKMKIAAAKKNAIAERKAERETVAAAKKNAIAERKTERETAKLEREMKKKCRPLLLELKKKLVPILKAKRQLKRLETAKAKKEAVAKRKAERELEKETKKAAKKEADAAKAERKQAKEAAKAEKEANKAPPAPVKAETKPVVEAIVMPPTPPASPASPDAQPEPEGDELMKQLEELLPSPKEEDEGRANWEQNFAKLMATITVDETEYDVVKPNKEPVYNAKKSVYNKPKGKAPKDIAMWHAEAGVWLKERA